ncbi:5'-methylthioadenosine/S-adenosylhomocysteine nucleosidase 1-like isoform X3 [Punica granatum]|uniref:5'-methylthioadenosine/S-adenosylhomocysteine nucleosidase 1-like isoform X3 n=1 Tax=Punica granatum TaxID=22663 RepID=A0A6P8DG68_PUNGR|nr:5'-methylthioadenosine/S-adenosylhomocysteine nucleosidase 1-like isoform X3 [Punica granatum]
MLFPEGVPWVRYHGIYKDLEVNVIWPGQDPLLGVNNVGTISAALVTYASVTELKPDLIINAGTAGGFGSKGACVGDVFLVSHIAFNHRRIPLPSFDVYGIGLRQAFSTPLLLKEVNLKVGKLSTGDSFDMSPEDEALVRAIDATLIDMEGAAVAYVADLLKVPAIFVKAVTNIVDAGNPSLEEFHANLADVSATLNQAVGRLVDKINGKRMSEL